MSKQSVGERLFEMAFCGVSLLAGGAAYLYSFIQSGSEDVDPLIFWPLKLFTWGVEAGLLERESAVAFFDFINPTILLLIGFACLLLMPVIFGALVAILLTLAIGIPFGLLALIWLGLKELVCREIASGINRVDEIRREKNDASSRDSG